MIALITDSSVILKWFHSEGEDELPAARAVLQAHRDQQLGALILDLTLYELGNILLRRLGWAAAQVTQQLDDIVLLCGPPLSLLPEWRHDAADLAEQHRLTFYDAAFAAAARGLQVPLLSADRELLQAGLAESVSAFAQRMHLV
ncbi:MAG TPA: type II toxin-antitoxin system VapC family toxin [Chloroflexota bacterium]|nr:type II toxin-antitoxin system VapC family toxin [Chloroflexota bacterium]